MTIPAKPSYDHGSTGTQPTSARDYESGDPLDADEFDHYLSELFSSVDSIIDALNAIDSDNDEKVDAADTADDATNVTSTYKGNDIDSDGDGKVNSADTADSATDVTSTYKGNDIDTDGDGTVDSADDAANVTSTYKGNDIDTDGDGKVNAADTADNATQFAGQPQSFYTTDTELSSHTATADAHHSRYTDAEARTAVDGANVDIAGDAETVDGISIYVQSTEPASPQNGDIWIDTS